jgi:hypothetical protein
VLGGGCTRSRIQLTHGLNAPGFKLEPMKWEKPVSKLCFSQMQLVPLRRGALAGEDGARRGGAGGPDARDEGREPRAGGDGVNLV